MNPEVGFVKSPLKGRGLHQLTSLLVFITAPAMLEGVHWLLALAAHFRSYLLVAWVLCGVAHGVQRSISGVLVAAVTSAFLVLGLQVDPPPEAATQGDLEVMQVNVEMDAEDTAPLIEHIREANPDVVSLVEVDERWLKALTSALDYPYVEASPRGDFLGLALLSRHPILAYEVGDLTPGIPASTAELKVADRPITLTTLHVLPPVTGAWARSQAEGLHALAGERSKRGTRWVVCGDFNATPWSRAFRTFVAESGLSPISSCGWFSGTWPAWIPVTGLNIDHCLIASGLRSAGASIGPSPSGDHRPVSVSIDTSAP